MHNNSPQAMPVLHAAAPGVGHRDKLEGGRAFVMHTEFTAAGDQPTAIAELTEGVRAGERNQVLLGATGTGKTFTMARVIEETQRPAIILAPNKTLAAPALPASFSRSFLVPRKKRSGKYFGLAN